MISLTRRPEEILKPLQKFRASFLPMGCGVTLEQFGHPVPERIQGAVEVWQMR